MRELEYWSDADSYTNDIALEGFLCKAPIKLTSLLGCEICDLMLAVNRQYNKSDYILLRSFNRKAGEDGVEKRIVLYRIRVCVKIMAKGEESVKGVSP